MNMYIIIIALLLLALFLFEKVKKYNLFEKQRKYVLFCTASEEFHSNSSLLDILNNKNSLYIKDDEREAFYTILRGYQFEIFRLFSIGSLTKDKKMLSLPREEFFVTTFKSYLDEHSSDNSFLGNTMASFKGKVDANTSNYELTDFGYVFYKTCYATYNYEEQNGIIPKGNSDYLKDAITSRSIQIMRYIP